MHLSNSFDLQWNYFWNWSLVCVCEYLKEMHHSTQPSTKILSARWWWWWYKSLWAAISYTHTECSESSHYNPIHNHSWLGTCQNFYPPKYVRSWSLKATPIGRARGGGGTVEPSKNKDMHRLFVFFPDPKLKLFTNLGHFPKTFEFSLTYINGVLNKR